MRKILAGLLATSMVVSMATIASAATKPSTSVATLSGWVLSPDNLTPVVGSGAGDKWGVSIPVKSLDIEFKKGATVLGVVSVPVNKTIDRTGGTAISDGSKYELADFNITAADLAKLLSDYSFAGVRMNETYYSGKVAVKDEKVTLSFDKDFKVEGLTAIDTKWNLGTPVFSTNVTDNGVSMLPDMKWDANYAVTALSAQFDYENFEGKNPETIETEKDGDMAGVAVYDILVCDPDGTPIPLTEKDTGVNKNLNASGGVQSGQTVYFMVRDDSAARFDKLEDDSFWDMKISKSNNGKYVKAVSDVTKIFKNDLYDARAISGAVEGTGGNTRHRYIKVELNEIYTDDEYKISLDVRLTAKDPAVRTGIVTKDETLLKVKDFSFWMKNIIKSADNDWVVGLQGLMLNPMLNDWNNVTYMDEVDDVAFVRFFGDSDIDPFYAKLSTKWTHDDYAAYFNDQDAFYFEFTGSPKLSSTSRADLQIYDPFTDIDGNSTFDASTATIYQIVDGDLIDVTDSFTYGEGDNGENAFITRTRFLGSYIICEKPVDEAVGEEDIDDLMPDDEEIPVAPITPDTNAGGKNPANTGRYN